MVSTRLFKRAVSFEVLIPIPSARGVGTDTFKVSDLRMAFKVEKSLVKDPNKLELSIFNLSEDSRRRLQRAYGPSALQPQGRLLAGYVDNVEQIFIGDISKVTHAKEGTEWVSKFSAGDGEKGLRTGRAASSFAKGTSAEVVLNTLAKTIGATVPQSTIDLFRAGNFRKGFTEYSKGLVAAGWAQEEIDKVMRTCGLEWSIQDGQVQALRKGEAIGETVVVLSAATGLIGSPEVGEKGIVKARGLIQQRLLPGWRVDIRSALPGGVVGIHRIEKVTFTGDNFGGEWYADIEARIL